MCVEQELNIKGHKSLKQQGVHRRRTKEKRGRGNLCNYTMSQFIFLQRKWG